MKTFLMVLFCVGTMSLFPCLVFGENDLQNPEELFVMANSAYKNSDFDRALELYNQIEEVGFVSGNLFYNLGNTWFRLGKNGFARLNYERAMVMMPDDPDLVYNASYVNDQLVDNVTLSEPLWQSMFFWTKSMNLKETLYLFIVINLVFWSLLILRLFFKKEILFYIIMIVALFWSVAGASVGVKWYGFKFDDRAVVVAKQVDVLAGPSERDTLLFRLHEGTMVRYERDEEQWTLVRLSDNRRGWVKAECVRRVQFSETGS